MVNMRRIPQTAAGTRTDPTEITSQEAPVGL